MLNYLQSSASGSGFLPLVAGLSCEITKNPTLLPVDFKTRDFDTN